MSSKEPPAAVTSSGPILASPYKALATGRPASAAELRFAVRGTAIITGGVGDLGIESSKALLQHGLSGLMILDMNVSSPSSESKLSALRAQYSQAKIEARDVDVTDELAVNAAIEETTKLLGSVDILLCCAGIVSSIHTLDTTASYWRRVLDVNTTGTFLCAQAWARTMIRQGYGGSIIFIASLSGHRVNFPEPHAAYNASKAALISLKSHLAAEWARYGIRTNSISPGYMDTVLNAGEPIREAREVWAGRNPMGRMGSPSELTGAVVLLASDAGLWNRGTY